jgi:peroxiredoxin
MFSGFSMILNLGKWIEKVNQLVKSHQEITMSNGLYRLFPNQEVPPLKALLTGGGNFELAAERPERFTLVIFYRGLHCPICRKHLGELEQRLDDFLQRGVTVIALSSDTRERAEQTQAEWKIPRLRLGYGVDLDTARRWGLYISTGRGVTSIGIEEPALFSEPGLFLVRPDGTLYFASVQTMPFARPHFADIVSALDFVIAKNYPARGDVTSLTGSTS